MEINGKKVRTLPQQVLQNQEDIAELKKTASTRPLYLHTLGVSGHEQPGDPTDDWGTIIKFIDSNPNRYTINSLKSNPISRIYDLNIEMRNGIMDYYGFSVIGNVLYLNTRMVQHDDTGFWDDGGSDYIVDTIEDAVHKL